MTSTEKVIPGEVLAFLQEARKPLSAIHQLKEIGLHALVVKHGGPQLETSLAQENLEDLGNPSTLRLEWNCISAILQAQVIIISMSSPCRIKKV